MNDHCSHPQCWCNNRGLSPGYHLADSQESIEGAIRERGDIPGKIRAKAEERAAKATCGKCYAGYRYKPGDNFNGTRCDWRSDDSLTFAEAMALDPSEVEGQFGEKWWHLDDRRVAATLTLDVLRHCEFRRSRPKRSRVEEMAEQHFKNGTHENYVAQKAATETIRSVCKWLRGYDGNLSPSFAEAIELHFLSKDR